MNHCAEGGGGLPDRRRGGAALMLALTLGGTLAAAGTLPPPVVPAAPLEELAHLQRFLTPAVRPHPPEPPLRVLFYGQSIIGQWYAAFRDHLRRRYPDRPWQFENRALDGHLAPHLLRTAEADVYRLQPDLLVFHACDEGAPWASYAELLRRVRQRTCADILMVGNHLAVADALDAQPTAGVTAGRRSHPPGSRTGPSPSRPCAANGSSPSASPARLPARTAAAARTRTSSRPAGGW